MSDFAVFKFVCPDCSDAIPHRHVRGEKLYLQRPKPMRDADDPTISGAASPAETAPRSNITEPDPLLTYAVRKCRDHWHVTAGGEDLDVAGDPFRTADEALDAANALNRGEWIANERHVEPCPTGRKRFALPDTPAGEPPPDCATCGHDQNRHHSAGCLVVKSFGGGSSGGVRGCPCTGFVASVPLSEAQPSPSETPEALTDANLAKWASGDTLRIPTNSCDGLITALASSLSATRDELAEAKKPIPCGVCCGQPLASGRPCICKGIGTEHAEMQGLRELAFELERECASQRERAEAAEAKRDELQDEIDSYPDIDACAVLCRVFPDGADQGMEEWREWYKPEQWFGMHRALGAFISQRLENIDAMRKVYGDENARFRRELAVTRNDLETAHARIASLKGSEAKSRALLEETRGKVEALQGSVQMNGYGPLIYATPGDWISRRDTLACFPQPRTPQPLPPRTPEANG